MARFGVSVHIAPASRGLVPGALDRRRPMHPLDRSASAYQSVILGLVVSDDDALIRHKHGALQELSIL
jgi:hypothetical protein